MTKILKRIKELECMVKNKDELITAFINAINDTEKVKNIIRKVYKRKKIPFFVILNNT